MELQTITMPGDTEAEQRAAATKALLEYRESVRERRSADNFKEDQQIMKGYKALGQGKQLIHLTDTIRAGGVNRAGLPKLAIVQAAARWCHLYRSTDGSFEMNDDGDFRRTRHARSHEFPVGILPTRSWSATSRFKALVPIIPPALRPSIALSNFHILFEAEWKEIPPKDPALLRHLGGDLYAVVAVWNLTELERAVLSGRFNS